MKDRSTASDWVESGTRVTRTFWFSVPRGVDGLSLWDRDPHWLLRLLPGGETSFLHPKKLFVLE